MAEIIVWVAVTTADQGACDWSDLAFYLGGVALGQSLVGVTNWADVPVEVVRICRSDFGRVFRDLPEPVPVSPGRTVWIDLDALPEPPPVLLSDYRPSLLDPWSGTLGRGSPPALLSSISFPGQF